ncbi:hypothetical protein M3P05_16615 [Sansalvadorimonas sp. 2012CJ34-2]|uniref:Uncharacterized protein n=1 Tax=Parendozoicomonas callyspongiae TaxID=2942213 RepID=A0ABT0PJH3_9GAMM|nr:hypothetical protein [Sansalvadorimonas sp. 2012CJ34-2]MCL6271540.1 hypothetical protein [Sansalvadorimonas sp. 2012CJ34-2]
MNEKRFISEVTRRLTRIYEQIKAGQPAETTNLHRVEGFMNAGVFMGVLTNQQLNELIEKVHQDVLGISVSERRRQNQCHWHHETTDYSSYETPTYERGYRRQYKNSGVTLCPEK